MTHNACRPLNFRPTASAFVSRTTTFMLYTTSSFSSAPFSLPHRFMWINIVLHYNFLPLHTRMSSTMAAH